MPAQGKKSLPVAIETHKKIRVAAAQMGREMYALVDDAIEFYLKSIANSGDAAAPNSAPAPLTSPPAENQPPEGSKPNPAKDPFAGLGDSPDDVVSLLRTHWSDPDFRACAIALGIVWDVGDPDIKDSLARNCHTFARSSRMVEALRDTAAKRPGYQQRIAELLEHADRIMPQALRGEGAPGGAAGGAAGSPAMGSGPVPARAAGRKTK